MLLHSLVLRRRTDSHGLWGGYLVLVRRPRASRAFHEHVSIENVRSSRRTTRDTSLSDRSPPTPDMAISILLAAEELPWQQKKRQTIPASWVAKKTVRAVLNQVAPLVLGRTPDLTQVALSEEDGDFIVLDDLISDTLRNGDSYVIHTPESIDFVLEEQERRGAAAGTAAAKAAEKDCRGGTQAAAGIEIIGES